MKLNVLGFYDVKINKPAQFKTNAEMTNINIKINIKIFYNIFHLINFILQNLFLRGPDILVKNFSFFY